MYKVSEVAKNLGVTVAGVYKAIKQLDKRYINKIDGVTYIDDDGYDLLKRRFEDSKGQKQDAKIDDGVVVSLLKQLEEKDRQIAEKDSQISQLIEQARNYQVLLKVEQDRNLSLVQKQGFFSRLFLKKGKSLDDD